MVLIVNPIKPQQVLSKRLSLPKRRKAAKIVVTPQFAMALDKTKVTDRSAAYVLTKTVRSIGQDP